MKLPSWIARGAELRGVSLQQARVMAGVRAALAQRDIPFALLNPGAVAFTQQGTQAAYTLIIAVDDDAVLTSRCDLPVEVPERHRERVTDLVELLNLGSETITFELDSGDGKVSVSFSL